VMTPDEIFSEVTAVYDNYVDALETGSVEALEAYARNGGSYREEVIEDCGHSPHVEKPGEFRRALLGFLQEHLRPS